MLETLQMVKNSSGETFWTEIRKNWFVQGCLTWPGEYVMFYSQLNLKKNNLIIA